MRKLILWAVVAWVSASPVLAQTLVKVAWCGPVLHSGSAPFAVAEKLGWFAEGGLKVQMVPLPGSSDCIKQVATGDLPFAYAAPEPAAILYPQGVKTKVFFSFLQTSIYGLAVPADSPIRTIADLKGKTIGVTAMASTGVIVARAMIANAGMNPDTDTRIVVAGEGAQTAALIRSHQVDALSQFAGAYALIENAGVALRMLDNSAIEKFPANGLVASDTTLTTRRADALALGRGVARGIVFAMANPEAATRMLWAVYPQTRPASEDPETVAKAILPLTANIRSMHLKPGGVTKWGESNLANYDAYYAFLLKWGVLKQPVAAKDLVTNDMVDAFNTFDAAAVEAQAKAWKP
jgi:NitT/TauT family transport system substrate-binding protein